MSWGTPPQCRSFRTCLVERCRPVPIDTHCLRYCNARSGRFDIKVETLPKALPLDDGRGSLRHNHPQLLESSARFRSHLNALMHALLNGSTGCLHALITRVDQVQGRWSAGYEEPQAYGESANCTLFPFYQAWALWIYAAQPMIDALP